MKTEEALGAEIALSAFAVFAFIIKQAQGFVKWKFVRNLY
jgi:hypothetical protein